jgi:hypothetical protein
MTSDSDEKLPDIPSKIVTMRNAVMAIRQHGTHST